MLRRTTGEPLLYAGFHHPLAPPSPASARCQKQAASPRTAAPRPAGTSAHWHSEPDAADQARRVYSPRKAAAGARLAALPAAAGAGGRAADPRAATARAAEPEPGPRKYHEMQSIVRQVEAGDTALLRGTWLLNQLAEWNCRPPRLGDCLRRRQELPEEAFWEPEEFKRCLDKRAIQVVAVSYCWYSKQHPDPQGMQLQTLWRALELHAREYAVRELALFIDWCSLHQRPRIPVEQLAFERALQNVGLWYAHRDTAVWLLTDVPPHLLDYHARGWPTFERAVSDLAPCGKVVLDLGRFQKFHVYGSFGEVEEACAAGRQPPLAPLDFSSKVQSCTFTLGKDRAFVARKYGEIFEELLGMADSLSFANLGWAAREVVELAKPLPLLARLRRLDLEGNATAAEGVQALADALPECEFLAELLLRGNSIGDVGMLALANALPHCRLRVLNLSNNSVGGDGAAALAHALPRSCLEELVLGDASGGNAFQDDGTKAIAEVLPRCRALTLLSLRRNGVGDRGAAALVEALAKGRPAVQGLRCVDAAAKGLAHLDLRDNVLGDSAARAFAGTLPHVASLELLNLNFNSIGEDGVRALQQAWRGPQQADQGGLYVERQRRPGPGSEAEAAEEEGVPPPRASGASEAGRRLGRR